MRADADDDRRALIGAGLENRAWLVGGDVVLRCRSGDAAAMTVEREAALLRAVAGISPLPVPAPLRVHGSAACLSYRLLPGRSLLELPADAWAPRAPALGAALGAFLAALHRAPVERFAPLVPVDADPALERSALVLSHNDLGAEHVLVDPETWRITGIIDWTDAALCDPAYDLGLVLRDLGDGGFEAALLAYGAPDDAALRARAAEHARAAAAEDLAYGLEHDRPVYAERARAALARLG